MKIPLYHYALFATLASIVLPSDGLCTYIYRQPISPTQVYSLEDFFRQGHTTLHFRARHENADDDAYNQLGENPQFDGYATTLSTKLTYNTGRLCYLYGVLEFNNVTSYYNNHHNSGDNTSVSKEQYAQISDPKGTALMQAYLTYQKIPATDLYVGRQIIRLDNERFVGPSDFRQMPQTFDALSVINHSLPNIELYYGFIWQVNSIWQGNESAFDHHRRNHTHLLNMTSKLPPFGEVIAYDYVINDQTNWGNSTNTFGLCSTGSLDISYFTFYGLGEYARQHSRNNNPLDYHANYYHLNGGVKIYLFDLSTGYEVLDGDDKAAGKAFRTPLGSRHIFNGLADRFVITPDTGLKDLYAQVKLAYWKLEFYSQYHHFKAQTDSETYGHEWDYGIKLCFLNHYTVSAELADFSGKPEQGFSDLKKYWLTLTANFG